LRSLFAFTVQPPNVCPMARVLSEIS
jgi:hypothetical protein